ncbi:MAG: Bifunctional riboflavin kinase/FMN adenylyltransferase [Candidatus Celerinatantimonas neptuna]|nr:MAG: Bifunctional riboflavin kinase/FMN adenylyltransferase [Candidatus Celerinatantimonas neptuna]
MKLIRGIHNIRPEHANCVLTIGNFDGVHLGHQSVIEQVLVKAKELNTQSSVMLFEPQPREFFSPTNAPERVSSFRDKYQKIAQLGVDQLLVIRFCSKFARLTAEQFVQQLLVKQLAVRHLVIGDDFRFGLKRLGDFSMLERSGVEYGFSVGSTQSFCSLGLRVSSTLLRKALSDGHFNQVKHLLGRAYTIQGKVGHGAKLGRQLGFPTANLRLPRSSSPLQGVFAVVVRSVNGQHVNWPAIANVGKRPSANGQELLLEVHILDRQEFLYGQRLVVEPLIKLRDEVKFNSLDILQQHVNSDIQRAKVWFESQDY